MDYEYSDLVVQAQAWAQEVLAYAWATEAGEEGGYQGTNLFIDDQIDNKDKDDYLAPNDGMNSGVPN